MWSQCYSIINSSKVNKNPDHSLLHLKTGQTHLWVERRSPPSRLTCLKAGSVCYLCSAPFPALSGCSSAKSRPTSCDPHGLQHARLLCPSLPPGVCANSCPLSRWCHPTISSSVSLFSSCSQSVPASGSFPMSQLFLSDGQSIRVSASILPTNIQGWVPLGVVGLISFQSEGLSRVFSGTIICKDQFFSAQPSLWSNSYIDTWLLENP